MSSSIFTIFDLQRATGVSARTLRRWTKSKLLPKAIGRGRAARYDDDHLLRAQVIRQLRAERRAHAEIHERLCTSSREQLAASLRQPVTVEAPPGAALSEPAYPFTSWEVVPLAAGLALLVNPARGPAVRQLADQLYRQCAAARAATLSG